MTKFELSEKVQGALNHYNAVILSIAERCMEGGSLYEAIYEEVCEDDARTIDYNFTADAVYRYVKDVGEVTLDADDVDGFEMAVKRHERVLDLCEYADDLIECLVLKVLYNLINSDIFDDLDIGALSDLWKVRINATHDLTIDALAVDFENWLCTYYTK